MSSIAASEGLSRIREINSDRESYARAWRAVGGKVMGIIGDGAPYEMLAAAGYLPFRLAGTRGKDRRHLGQILYPVYNKSQQERPVSLPCIDAIVDLLVSGEVDYLDHLLIPYSRREVSIVFGQLRAVADARPDLKLPAVTLLDRTMTTSYASSVYNRTTIYQFKEVLEKLSGQPLEEDRLANAISLANEGRELLGRLTSVRANGLIKGSDAFAAIATAQLVDRAEHNRLLKRYIEDASGGESSPAPAVFLAGSAQDQGQIYTWVEECGASVVGENHDWGQRVAEDLIDHTLSPLDGIAQRYHSHVPGIELPLSKSLAKTRQRAVACAATCTLYWLAAGDELQRFDMPHELSTLTDAGMPSLILENQPYAPAEPAVAEIRRTLKEWLGPMSAT